MVNVSSKHYEVFVNEIIFAFLLMKRILKLYSSSFLDILTERIKLFLPLNHNDMISELCLDRGVRVDWVSKAWHGQGKGGILERSNHWSAGLNTQYRECLFFVTENWGERWVVNGLIISIKLTISVILNDA